MTDHLSEIDKRLSILRHPSGDTSEKLVETLQWFNSLKPDEKSDVFLFLLGAYAGGR